VLTLGLALRPGLLSLLEFRTPTPVAGANNIFPRRLSSIVLSELSCDLALDLIVHVIHVTPHDAPARVRAYNP
jgi:hypothetical protein